MTKSARRTIRLYIRFSYGFVNVAKIDTFKLISSIRTNLFHLLLFVNFELSEFRIITCCKNSNLIIMFPINKLPGQRKIILLLIIALFPVKLLIAQDYRFGVYATPMISWFKTDIDEVKNQGARAGFIISISAERYLTNYWYFNAGLSFINSSGRLKSSSPTHFRFPDFTSIVAAGDPVIYRIQYISIPVGIKVKTSEAGYLSYFAEFGVDPKVVINGRADIPSIDIKSERAMTEIRRFNFAYHFNGGVDYSIDGNTSLILGLGFESNVFDITKDVDNQPKDRTSQKLLKFIFGINF